MSTRSIPGDPSRERVLHVPTTARRTPRPLRRLAVGLLLGLLVVLASPHLGRAVPTNNYRPLLPPDALATGCFPLPGSARLDLAHQVRRDGEVLTDRGLRRHLVGQFDLVDPTTAQRQIVASFARVGFRPEGEAWSGGPLLLVDAAGEEVRVTVSAIPGVGPGTLVRGDFLLDLPPPPPSRDDPVCSDPKSTKRWSR